MAKTLIAEFGRWSSANYEIVIQPLHYYYGTERYEMFVTREAALVRAENLASEGHTVEVYELEREEN